MSDWENLKSCHSVVSFKQLSIKEDTQTSENNTPAKSTKEQQPITRPEPATQSILGKRNYT